MASGKRRKWRRPNLRIAMLKLRTFAAVAAIAAGTVAALADGTPSMKDKPAAAPATPDFDIAFGGGVASDYVFRGISQSDRWPSGNVYTELRYNVTPTVQFYDAIAIKASIIRTARRRRSISMAAYGRPSTSSPLISAIGITGIPAGSSSTVRDRSGRTPIAPTASNLRAAATSMRRT